DLGFSGADHEIDGVMGWFSRLHIAVASECRSNFQQTGKETKEGLALKENADFGCDTFYVLIVPRAWRRGGGLAVYFPVNSRIRIRHRPRGITGSIASPCREIGRA